MQTINSSANRWEGRSRELPFQPAFRSHNQIFKLTAYFEFGHTKLDFEGLPLFSIKGGLAIT